MGRKRYGLVKKSTFIIILLGFCAVLIYEGYWFTMEGSPFGICTIMPRFWNLEPTSQMISTSRLSTQSVPKIHTDDVQRIKNIQSDIYNVKKGLIDVQNTKEIHNDVLSTKKIQNVAQNREKVQGVDAHNVDKIHNDVQNSKKIQSGVHNLAISTSENASLKPNSTGYAGWQKAANAILNSTILKHHFRTVPHITKDHKDTVTSAKFSVLEIVNEPKVGQNFTVRIHARDGLNRPKTRGGDFWFPFLEFPSKHYYASTSAPVLDHQNGTYTVDFFVGWASAVEIKITLVHPREAVQVLDSIRRIRYPPRLFWKGTFESKDNRTASTLCYVDFRGTQFWKDKCSYGNGRALGVDTALVCERPSEGFGCDSLVKYTTARETIRDASYAIGNACGCMWLFEKDHYMQPIKPQIVDMTQHLGSQYEILDNMTKSLPLCNSHHQSGIGFWRANYWVSMVCQAKQWHKFGAKRVGECLRNKDVYFLGDSTTRQWVFQLLDILKSPVNTVNYSATYNFKYNRYFDSFNLNVTFQFHPHIIGSKEVYLENEMYEVDVIDNLQNGDCNYIVVISPWAHFAQWWKNAFVERMRLLRESVDRLKTRCPDAKVVLKGPHVREHGDMYTQLLYSDYIIRKIKEEIEEAFEEADIYYINVWDLNSGFKGEKAVHMPTTVIRQELSILLSYLCSQP